MYWFRSGMLLKAKTVNLLMMLPVTEFYQAEKIA
jgi:hypothetical protein